MSKLKNDKDNYEKYLKGEMSAEEAHVFEKEVLNDPFEQEALEGLEAHESAKVFSDIDKLKGKVLAKKKGGYSWMKIAAVISLLIASSLAIWFSIDQVQDDPELAMEKQELPPGENAEEEQTEESEKFFAKEDKEDADVTDQEAVVDEKEAEGPANQLQNRDTQLALAKPLKTETNAQTATGQPTVTSEEPVETSSLAVTEDLAKVNLEESAVAAQGAGFSRADEDAFMADDVAEEVVFNETDAADALERVPAEIEIDSETSIASEDFDDSGQNDVARILSGKTAGLSTSTKESKKRARKAKKSADARSLASAPAPGFVTGNITDDTGEPLPGVNVVIKGSTTGTTTDVDGNYILSVDPGSSLVLSFVGFESQEIEVGSRNVIDATLGGVSELQEVVVTGYGIEKGDEIDFYSPAQPVGGTKSFKDYLEANLKYPQEARDNQIEGTVVLELKISPNGSISDISVKKSLGYGCDTEAIRLVQEGPKWRPASKGNDRLEDKVRVRVKFEG